MTVDVPSPLRHVAKKYLATCDVRLTVWHVLRFLAHMINSEAL